MREFKVSLLDALCFLENTKRCKDNDTDAYRTAEDLISRLNKTFIYLPVDWLESYLYMCNMNREDGKWWHPTDKPFTKVVSDILPEDLTFDRINNFIKSKKKR